jgi:hypothetical protein
LALSPWSAGDPAREGYPAPARVIQRSEVAAPPSMTGPKEAARRGPAYFDFFFARGPL